MLPAGLAWLLIVVPMVAAAAGAIGSLFIGGQGGWSILGVSLVIFFGIPIHFVWTRSKYVPLHRVWIVEPERGHHQEWYGQAWHTLLPGMQMVADIPWDCDIVFRLFPNGTPSVTFQDGTAKTVVADATLRATDASQITYGVSGGMAENRSIVTDLLQGAIQDYCRSVTLPEVMLFRGANLAGTDYARTYIAAVQSRGWHVRSLVVRDIQ